MAKARELKGRIRSVQNTRKITRTMEMVATSKLKRAQDRVAAARPYAERLGEVIARLLNPELAARYPLLRQPEQQRRAAVLLLTANRGLAGAFNVNLIREARELVKRLRAEGTEVDMHIAGKKGIAFFRFAGEQLATADTGVSDRPSAEDARRLVEGLMDDFVAGTLDAVYVVYAKFNSALSTPPATLQLLPIQPPRRTARAERARWTTSWSPRPTRSWSGSSRCTCAAASTGRWWRPRPPSRARAAPP
jgi:F-type H+-transporting ATPase subunit gamma